MLLNSWPLNCYPHKTRQLWGLSRSLIELNQCYVYQTRSSLYLLQIVSKGTNYSVVKVIKRVEIRPIPTDRMLPSRTRIPNGSLGQKVTYEQFNKYAPYAAKYLKYMNHSPAGFIISCLNEYYGPYLKQLKFEKKWF